MSRIVYHGSYQYLTVKVYTTDPRPLVPAIRAAMSAILGEIGGSFTNYIVTPAGIFVSVAVRPVADHSATERNRVGKEVELARELIREEISKVEPDSVNVTMTAAEKVKGTNLCPRCGNHPLYTKEDRRRRHCEECSRQLMLMVPDRKPVFTRVPTYDEIQAQRRLTPTDERKN